MEIEQLPPEESNFNVVFTAFTVTLVVVLLLALVFLHRHGKHLTFRRTHTETTTQLTIPAAPNRLA